MKPVLFRALVLIASAALGEQAAALSLSADGRGQVLLYPYYTTQGSGDTIVTVANTASVGKSLRLRFREAKNGRPVLELNVYLSPDDEWTAAITRNPAGNPILRVSDLSCTVPELAPSATVPGTREIAFSNAAYAGFDRAGSGLDRAREGYLEVIEMGAINPTFSLPTSGGSIAFGQAVLANGGNCGAVAAAWNTGGAFLSSSGAELNPPTGGLIGTGTLINVEQGTDFSYDPTALAGVLGGKAHTAPGSASPSLNDASTVSRGVVNDAVQQSNWSRGADAVSALLMHFAVWNEYVTAPELAASTDLILTFPTKPFHVALESDASGATLPPFTARFDDREPIGEGATGPLLADGTSTGACESININRYGRNGELNRQTDFPENLPYATEVCWTASVITLGNVLGSQNLVAYVNSPEYSHDGPIRVAFIDEEHKLVSTEGHQYLGLPVIGFVVQKYVNGNVGGVLSNYGGAFAHKYETVIQ